MYGSILAESDPQRFDVLKTDEAGSGARPHPVTSDGTVPNPAYFQALAPVDSPGNTSRSRKQKKRKSGEKVLREKQKKEVKRPPFTSASPATKAEKTEAGHIEGSSSSSSSSSESEPETDLRTKPAKNDSDTFY